MPWRATQTLEFDWTGFVVSFKGVFLEGLEVAFIVLTFGANSGTSSSWALSAAGALLAFVIVGLRRSRRCIAR